MKTNVKTEEAKRQADKYLTFMLAGESYGVEILKALEIVGMLEITPVPCTPHFVMGVANLRGKIIPIVNLRRKVGMRDSEITSQSCIIVVRSAQREAGLLVDKVLEVTPIDAESIEETPDFGPQCETNFIQGLAKTTQGVTILLNLEHVLEQKDFTIIDQVAGSDALAATTETTPC